MKKKRSIALLLAFVMLVGLLGACGSSSSSEEDSSSETAAASESAEASESEDEEEAEEAEEPEEPEEAEPEEEEPVEEGAEPADEGEEAEEPAEEVAEESSDDLTIVRVYNQAEPLPLTTDDVTITAWDYVVPPVMAVIDDYGVDGLVYATLQEITGIHMEFTTASLLNASDSMALMVAANELPDLIFDFGSTYNGNLDDLIDADELVDFNNYRDLMPNYFDILDNNVSIARDVVTEGGAVCMAANIYDILTPDSGPCIRQDWLDADGLDVPVTVDDLYNVLKTFQSENNCEHPFWISSNGSSSLNTAYGITYNGVNNSVGGVIYVDGQIEYCLDMDGFRDYVQLMTDWYAEGLISPDFVTREMLNSANASDELVDNGAGFWTCAVNSIIELSGFEPDADVEPIHRIVLNEGDLCSYDDAGTSLVAKGGAVVASSNPEVELTLQLLDYGYSDDGILLYNYGVEGVSFEYNDEGEPELTELVTNNEQYDFSVCLIKYTSGTPASVSINERNYLGYTDAQLAALDLWMRDSGTESINPPGTLWNTDAQDEYNSIATDLGSYCSTRVLQFITGADSMDNWDSFIEEAYSSFDVDRMVELYQEAVDAYLAKA